MDKHQDKHQGMLEGQVSHLVTRTALRWEEEMEDHHHRMDRMVIWDLRQTEMVDLHLLGACGNLSHAIHQVKAMQLRRNKLSNMLG